ncbi:MAG: type I-C CRISPR-associated protein Cas5 [Clostridia bacterium]|jgi:CRISPR-associated protein Cas5d|nr:type I-C CRISPR-associated protein Cas5 [Clostridia bacterium]
MNQFVVEIWGDFACFTRPEAKVERLSYPVMTPSAARGVLDAIYAKPVEFSWRVTKIEVLKPIQFIPLRRNEVKDKISERAVRVAVQKGGELEPIIVDATRELYGTDAKGRTQRQTIALKDVHYRIHAYLQPRPNMLNREKALISQANRRIQSGKCFYQPYLGCREFAGYFAPGDDERQPINETIDLGWMLYDVFDLDQVNIGNAKPFISLFKAKLENGILHVPPWESPEVRKPS